MSDSSSPNMPLPSGPKGLGIKRFLHRVRNPIEFYEQLYEQYGEISYFRFFNRKVCVIYNPDMIEEVLVKKRTSFEKGPIFKESRITKNPTSATGDGEAHRRIRKLIQPAFRRKALDGYAMVMIDEAMQLRNSWRNGQTIDLDAAMHQMTLNIISKTFFGIDTRVDPNLIKELLKAITWSITLTMLPFSNLIASLPLAKNRQRHHVVAAIDHVVYDVIRKARANPEGRADLVTFLVHSTDEEGVDRSLSDEEVRDESYIMILAGHETTANALVWCFYHLWRNPDVRERLEQEIDEVLVDSPPTLADYNRLPYTRAVFDETLRITPPFYAFGRTAIEDCVIGNYHIPKGTVVQIYMRTPHQSETYFSHATEFNPERWLGPNKSTHPRNAYFPFGTGARACIGAEFAKLEAIFCLAALTQRWRITVLEEEYPEIVTVGVYRCKNGLRCRVEERK